MSEKTVILLKLFCDKAMWEGIWAVIIFLVNGQLNFFPPFLKK